MTNTGARRGAEVVQCYVAPSSSRLLRPRRELRAFEKVWLEPGESTTVSFELGDRAFAYWDPGDRVHSELMKRVVPMGMPSDRAVRHVEAGWYLEAGEYALHIGRSSAETAHVCRVRIEKDAGPLAP